MMIDPVAAAAAAIRGGGEEKEEDLISTGRQRENIYVRNGSEKGGKLEEVELCD